jgi:catechol 2,3-dioxygenase-like lactoylglutathione lyase family enzyme
VHPAQACAIVVPMALHHVALATRDLTATHRFYTEAMGFTLAKVQIGPTETEGGWARHVFYDTGDGMMAFWELHDESLGEFPTAISTDAGLPAWVNHLAFHATPDTIGEARDRWLAHGIDVVEVDHGWCVSIYANDPNGILVEWCANTRELDDNDRREAAELLAADTPRMDPPPIITVHEAGAVTA